MAAGATSTATGKAAIKWFNDTVKDLLR